MVSTPEPPPSAEPAGDIHFEITLSCRRVTHINDNKIIIHIANFWFSIKVPISQLISLAKNAADLSNDPTEPYRLLQSALESSVRY